MTTLPPHHRLDQLEELEVLFGQIDDCAVLELNRVGFDAPDALAGQVRERLGHVDTLVQPRKVNYYLVLLGIDLDRVEQLLRGLGLLPGSPQRTQTITSQVWTPWR